MRREVRKLKKREQCPEERVQLNTEFNRLTAMIRLNTKNYTEDQWKVFLNKLGPYPAASSVFWQIINRARSSKSSSSIPTLQVGDLVYEKYKEKAELFASVLTDTFTDAGSSSDFDRNFHSYVEEFVAKFDYVENSFDKYPSMNWLK